MQVTGSGGAAALKSPDGKFLYYVKEPGSPGLFRMPNEGGEEELVLPFPPEWGWAGFALTAKGIYFHSGENKTIHFLDPATGKVSLLATLDKPVGEASAYRRTMPTQYSHGWTGIPQT